MYRSTLSATAPETVGESYIPVSNLPLYRRVHAEVCGGKLIVHEVNVQPTALAEVSCIRELVASPERGRSKTT